MEQFGDLFTHQPDRKYRGIATESKYITMRDGTQVAVDILLPFGLEPGARLPVVLTMTRYWRSFELRGSEPARRAPIAPRESLADDLVLRGFAMVIVDARGSGASTGISRFPWSPEEIADYGEVAAWAVTQPWCNGSVGAAGISYEGTTALLLASTGHPEVKGVVPQQFEFDVYTDITFPGGIFNEAFVNAWSSGNAHLDSNKLPDWFPIPGFMRWVLKGVRPVDADRKSRQMLERAIREHQANTNVYEAISQITFRDDEFGNTGATLDDFSVFNHKTAVGSSGSALYLSGSWFDGATADTVVRIFNNFNNPQIGIIGAWSHEKTTHGSPYRKPKSRPDPSQAQQWAALAGFFERTLISGQPPQGKTLFYYTLGEEAWKQTDAFPLPDARDQPWYFQAGNSLSPEAPAAGSGFEEYPVDFDASTGRNNRWHTGLARPVIYPDRAREDRRLLTYTSTPLAQDMEVTGYPVVTLYAASSVEDAAIYVYLEDVDESGVVRYITEGQLRGLHRNLSKELPAYTTFMPPHSFKRADGMPLPPGEIVELTIGLHPTSVLFRRGHRIRVAIAGADRDTFARIPAQGSPSFRISRNQAMASHIRLPVVP